MKITKRMLICIMVLLLAIGLNACSEEDKNDTKTAEVKLTAEEQTKKDFEANIPQYRIAAKESVKSILSTPSTAKFPDEAFEGDQWPTIDNGDDTVYISSWVDAENDYGATVRNTFTVYLTKDTKECKYLSLNGEVVYDYLDE